jgi:hypothetical protein
MTWEIISEYYSSIGALTHITSQHLTKWPSWNVKEMMREICLENPTYVFRAFSGMRKAPPTPNCCSLRWYAINRDPIYKTCITIIFRVSVKVIPLFWNNTDTRRRLLGRSWRHVSKVSERFSTSGHESKLKLTSEYVRALSKAILVSCACIELYPTTPSLFAWGSMVARISIYISKL